MVRTNDAVAALTFVERARKVLGRTVTVESQVGGGWELQAEGSWSDLLFALWLTVDENCPLFCELQAIVDEWNAAADRGEAERELIGA